MGMPCDSAMRCNAPWMAQHAIEWRYTHAIGGLGVACYARCDASHQPRPVISDQPHRTWCQAWTDVRGDTCMLLVRY
ncbi:hypothetical protein LI328DRAFT_159358 [Trichoderma asperelloides]|nr:hypothetical protein LI328DRAFT_159358 [Trichoderma asperelloides]